MGWPGQPPIKSGACLPNITWVKDPNSMRWVVLKTQGLKTLLQAWRSAALLGTAWPGGAA